jgi:plastocyanin
MGAGMSGKLPIALLACLIFGNTAWPESVTGVILIKRRLTRPGVTASVSIYERGTAVPLGKDEKSEPRDPLAFERSRVVIWIEGQGPLAPLSASMEQTGRRFLPELLVITAGSTVAFPNRDPIFHNVFSLSKPKLFDLGNYPTGESRNVTFAKPGIVSVNCHLHPNMSATVVVTPNQWFARSDGAGDFTIPDVPPGEYKIVAWHKAAGLFHKTIHVLPKTGAKVDFFIPLAGLEPDAEKHR